MLLNRLMARSFSIERPSPLDRHRSAPHDCDHAVKHEGDRTSELFPASVCYRCIAIPAAAPTNNNRHTLDWMKNPGKRPSTARLYPAKYHPRPPIQIRPRAAATASLK